MTFIKIDELSDLRRKYRDKIIVYCSGTFDPFHAGHILFFEDSKKHGDILVVAVGNDSLIKGLKGDPHPILNEKVRIKIIDSLRIVDYCTLDTRPHNEYGEGEVMYDDATILEKLKPDKWVINDDVSGNLVRKEFANNLRVELVILKRSCPEEFNNISSSNIIRKIKLLE